MSVTYALHYCVQQLLLYFWVHFIATLYFNWKHSNEQFLVRNHEKNILCLGCTWVQLFCSRIVQYVLSFLTTFGAIRRYCSTLYFRIQLTEYALKFDHSCERHQTHFHCQSTPSAVTHYLTFNDIDRHCSIVCLITKMTNYDCMQSFIFCWRQQKLAQRAFCTIFRVHLNCFVSSTTRDEFWEHSLYMYYFL